MAVGILNLFAALLNVFIMVTVPPPSRGWRVLQIVFVILNTLPGVLLISQAVTD